MSYSYETMLLSRKSRKTNGSREPPGTVTSVKSVSVPKPRTGTIPLRCCWAAANFRSRWLGFCYENGGFHLLQNGAPGFCIRLLRARRAAHGATALQD